MPRAARKPAPPADGPLARYRSLRDFEVTAEPPGDGEGAADGNPAGALRFVVQKHWASRLHYDFRLELDGVLLSWAVPKGPSYDPADKPIAIRVEDHPLGYGRFEGTIPKGQYGAGKVIVWDHGTWHPEGDPRQGLKDGKLVFALEGRKLVGRWELVRIAKPGDRQEPWILFKKRDAQARPRAEYDVLSALPDSVLAGAAGAGTDGAPAGAVRAPLPQKLSPQLPTLAAAPPASGDWLWEVKFDGYRLMARVEGAEVRLFTRGGHDWTARLPGVARAVAGLGLASAWLDGEIVVMGPGGTPDFHALQAAIDHPRRHPVIDYFLFDLPFFGGFDLRKAPLVERRRLLQQLLQDSPQPGLRFSAAFEAGAAAIIESARRMGLEGVIAKRKDAAYESRRTDTWLKLKNRLRQEFVVAGYSDRAGGEAEVGALVLAVHDAGGALRHAGSVGTGWDAKTASALRQRLSKLAAQRSPLAQKVPGAVHWVKPQLVVEVEFAEWTPERLVRHAKFVGVREDKPAAEVTLELPLEGGRVAGIPVTHPGRVVDELSGVTKLELVRYYESVAEWMLPHLVGRPCSLVRGPGGVGGQLFFQKQLHEQHIPEVSDLPPGIGIGTVRGLVAAAQMNVIEFHTWNALARRMDKPDRMVFDLDPGEGVTWPQVKEAAWLVRGLLAELQLQSWLKTSGGKGLHVVVPLAPREGWDGVKAFSEAVVRHLAEVIPQRFVARSGAANRVGRIFVDYLRNGPGATTAAAFSARARPGLGVSMPMAWDELGELKASDQWTVRTAREHLSFQRVDPWADYGACRQTLAAGRKALGLAVSPPASRRR